MTEQPISSSAATKIFDGGPGPEGRVGLIVLADDPVAESEIAACLAGTGISLSVGRMPTPVNYSHETLKTLEPSVLQAMSTLLPADRLSTVALCCSALAGSLGRAHLAERIASDRPGVTFSDPGQAAIEVMRARGSRKISLLLTPEDDGINQAAAKFYASQGFSISWVASLALKNDLEMSTLSIDSICDALTGAAAADADTILVPCTAMRTWEAAKRLDHATSSRILTGNRALALHAQSLASKKPLREILAKHGG
ncbi:MAG: hypothetical protein K8F90_14945 [Hyphomicrobiales bacterium]|nr:hypothetical protein [Hyphomicrobiales bacterium]